MKNLLLFVLIILSAASIVGCASTNGLTMTIKEPALVPIKKSINKIGILDRSKPAPQNRVNNQIDQIITLEGKQLDSLGRLRQIEAIKAELLQNNDIDTVIIINENDLLNENPIGFGVQLTSAQIKNLCNTYGVEAIISLEYFDTDSRFNFNVRQTQINGPLGVKVPMVEQEVSIRTLIKSGWRMYDSTEVNAIDESVFSIPVSSVGRGISIMTAYNTIKNRKTIVLNHCDKIGRTEGARIAPHFLRVRREYYVRGSQRFKLGKRMALTGNWDDARKQWEKELEHPKPKIAGRAYYNMAVSSEINGNLDDAIYYASKGYEYFNNKKCLSYVNLLRGRKTRLENAKNLTGSE